MNLYAYSHQNPVRYHDPDGNEVGDKFITQVENNINVVRSRLGKADPSERSGRAVIATVAKITGRYNTFAEAASIIRSSPMEAYTAQWSIESELRKAAMEKFLPALAKAASEAGKDAYVKTPAVKGVSSFLKVTGALLAAGSTDTVEGVNTVRGIMSLGDLARRVNGINPDAANSLINEGIHTYAENCGSSFDC